MKHLLSTRLLGLGVEGENPWVRAVSMSHSPSHGVSNVEPGPVARRKGVEEHREARPLQRGHGPPLEDGSDQKNRRREPEPLAGLRIEHALTPLEV